MIELATRIPNITQATLLVLQIAFDDLLFHFDNLRMMFNYGSYGEEGESLKMYLKKQI